MNVKYYLKNVEGLIVPTRANETDAGYDVTATSEPKIVGVQTMESRHLNIVYIEFETGLYITPDADDMRHYHTDLRPRSSISKYNLTLANSVGLIDRGYKNQILVRFNYIWQPCDFRLNKEGDITGVPDMSKVYKKGDKICQLLPMTTHDIVFEIVNELPGDDRGGGFGSSDKVKI